MSVTDAGIQSCLATAAAIQGVVADNVLEEKRIADRRIEMDNEIDEIKRELRRYPTAPSRNVGSYPKYWTGCIYDLVISRRTTKAKNACMAKGAGYYYNGTYKSCGGIDACCKFDHECSISSEQVERTYREWKAGRDAIEARLAAKVRDRDALKPTYKVAPAFTCCTNVVQVIGSKIEDSEFDQINTCITSLQEQLQGTAQQPIALPTTELSKQGDETVRSRRTKLTFLLVVLAIIIALTALIMASPSST